MSVQPEYRPELEFDLPDRLRKSLRVADVSVQTMADYLEVNRMTISRWINGHTAPTAAAVRLWALRTGVPYEWLRHGWTSPGPSESAVSAFPQLARVIPHRRHRKPAGYGFPQVRTA